MFSLKSEFIADIFFPAILTVYFQRAKILRFTNRAKCTFYDPLSEAFKVKEMATGCNWVDIVLEAYYTGLLFALL